jgi:hypothetical protein
MVADKARNDLIFDDVLWARDHVAPEGEPAAGDSECRTCCGDVVVTRAALDQPRTRIGRRIKQYHLRHHFISEKHSFDVSNPTLDSVLGTFRGPGANEESAAIRDPL